jgi:Domain of unknown function (DUF4440)
MTKTHVSMFAVATFAAIVVGLAGTASPALAQRPSPHALDAAADKVDTALRDKLMAEETRYWNAWKAKDWAAVRKMMGDDGIWVDPLNVFSTEGFVKAVENGNVAFELGPRVFLRKPTSDVAVLVYDVKVGFGQTPKAEWPWLISAVFVNRGGQWIGVSRSEVRGNRPQPPAPPAGR